MPMIPPPSIPAAAFPIGSGYGMTWTPEQRTTPAYTANTQSTAYVGGLLDLLQAARLSDLNALRVAVENNRVFSENTRMQLNAMIADMTSKGVVTPS